MAPYRLVEVEEETYEQAKETYLDLREEVEKFEESEGNAEYGGIPFIDPELVTRALDILDQLMISYEQSIEESEDLDDTQSQSNS